MDQLLSHPTMMMMEGAVDLSSSQSPWEGWEGWEGMEGPMEGIMEEGSMEGMGNEETVILVYVYVTGFPNELGDDQIAFTYSLQQSPSTLQNTNPSTYQSILNPIRIRIVYFKIILISPNSTICMQYLGLSDNKKLGMVMMIASISLYSLGVMLFCNRPLIILGNICFILGMYLFIGCKGTIAFLTKKGKVTGAVCYFFGFFLIAFLGMSITGTVMQLVGFFIIFKSFLPDIYDYITKLPYVGKYLKSYAVQNFLDKISTSSNTSRI